MSRLLPLSRFALAVASAALIAGCTSEDNTPLAEPAPPAPPEEETQELPPLPEVVGAPVFEDINPDPHILEFDIFAHWGVTEFVPGSETNVMKYNDGTPGPMIHARVGDRIIAHFHNQIGEPTTIHWHGLRISDDMDGNPRVMNPVEDGESFTYDFVLPEAGTYWYHPHSNTIEQLERGLYGTIVVTEEEAPVFTTERIMALDDVRLTSGHQIAPFQKTAGMDVMHGRVGDLLANGSTEPITGTVAKGAIERWRLVNTSGARHMSLSLEGATMKVIATDGGLLPAPYVTDRLDMTVGQRFDLEVRFEGELGSQVRLDSYVLALDDNDNVIEVPVPVAEYTIDGETTAEEPVYPAVELLPIDASAPEQLIALSGVNGANGIEFTINGKSGMEIPDLMFKQGEPRVLKIVNELGMFHPFHLHGQWFQILTRQGLPANEPGLKDSVYVGGGQEVTVMTWFGNPGAWMYHCHIPEHAENGMMGHMIVEPSE